MSPTPNLTLYGGVQTRAGRCLWALEELGLPYRLVPVMPAVGDTRTPTYLALNPLGKVPTLVHDDFVLTESTAINAYLVELAPTPLWPTDARSRARIHQWSSWATTELEYHLTVMVREVRRAAPGAPDGAVIKACLEGCEASLAALESHLAQNTPNRAYVAGEAFTMGDVNTAFSVNFVASRIAMDRFPKAQAWLARCLARPAWARVTAINEAALPRA